MFWKKKASSLIEAFLKLLCWGWKRRIEIPFVAILRRHAIWRKGEKRRKKKKRGEKCIPPEDSPFKKQFCHFLLFLFQARPWRQCLGDQMEGERKGDHNNNSSSSKSSSNNNSNRCSNPLSRLRLRRPPLQRFSSSPAFY